MNSYQQKTRELFKLAIAALLARNSFSKANKIKNMLRKLENVIKFS